ncbi:hypothetical protein [Cryobacterium tepidiphilum]|uniref:hypothetical protein n=1 Tax=Cryobacterium tepidiphilum TaxID=2486026 RepID=UPI0011CD7089|nr:hypothetical protein [Cryobacterium tepidiphilum]
MLKNYASLFAAALLAVILSGCSTTGAAGATGKPSVHNTGAVKAGLSAEALCAIAREQITAAAFPKTALPNVLPTVSNPYLECVLRDNRGQLARLGVNYSDVPIAATVALHKSLTSGDDNSRKQCPGGAERLAVSARLLEETSMLCATEDRSIFEYVGRSTSGTVTVRVERALDMGAIASGEAQSWVTAATKEILAADGAGGRQPGGATSTDAEGTSRKTSASAQHIYDVCFKPRGTVDLVNSNKSLTNEVLNDFPAEWLNNAPVPEVNVAGVCHQHLRLTAIEDVWWVHIKDAKQHLSDSAPLRVFQPPQGDRPDVTFDAWRGSTPQGAVE